MTTNRYSKRRVARSNALYAIRSSSLATENSRKKLDFEEFSEFKSFIETNQNGKFSITKLQHLDLNREDDEKSLLEIAVLNERDAIVSLLLRAGALPYPFIIRESDIAEKINNFLWTSNSYFSPYVVKLCLANRFASVNDHCNCCKKYVRSLISLYPCRHLICDYCFWSYVIERKNLFQDIDCPLCHSIIAANHSDIDMYPLVADSIMDALRNPSQIIALKSKAKWLILPEVYNHAAAPKKKKRPFTALPMRAINRLNLGESRAGRNENIFKAVVQGNLDRVQALVAAGVDIDCRNEYGQTPLFVSCWKGHVSLQEALLLYGANPHIPDNAGHLPGDFALDGESNSIGRLFNGHNVASVARLIEIPDHPGAQDGGSFLLDDCVSDSFLLYLEEIQGKLPVAEKEKSFLECSDRYYYCDTHCTIATYLKRQIKKAGLGKSHFFPQMRFLRYSKSGYVPPHVDLARTNEEGLRSTHTFILYLKSEGAGGETVLLDHVPSKSKPEAIELAIVKPVRATLLVFPHLCPHEGRPAGECKILLRGEMVFI